MKEIAKVFKKVHFFFFLGFSHGVKAFILFILTCFCLFIFPGFVLCMYGYEHNF